MIRGMALTRHGQFSSPSTLRPIIVPKMFKGKMMKKQTEAIDTWQRRADARMAYIKLWLKTNSKQVKKLQNAKKWCLIRGMKENFNEIRCFLYHRCKRYHTRRLIVYGNKVDEDGNAVDEQRQQEGAEQHLPYPLLTWKDRFPNKKSS